MLINEALELIKKEKGLQDQYDLSRELGVSQATVSNYVNGKSYPTLSVASKIYGEYGHRVEPFTEWALQKDWEIRRKKADESESKNGLKG